MRIFFLSVVLLVLVTPLWAQDPVSVNPKAAKLEFDNDRVRVVRIRMGPHERFGMHSHFTQLVIRVTDGFTRMYPRDGASQDVKGPAHELLWHAPTTHDVENLADQPLENVEIEFKKAAAPAVAVAAPHAQQVPTSPDAVVSLMDEPRHHWKLENQYVLVTEVILAPGESTFFHTHSHDNISVELTDAVVQRQFFGKEWSAPAPVKVGEVHYLEGDQKSYVHRVKNTGTTTFDVIDIELLE